MMGGSDLDLVREEISTQILIERQRRNIENSGENHVIYRAKTTQDVCNKIRVINELLNGSKSVIDGFDFLEEGRDGVSVLDDREKFKFQVSNIGNRFARC